MSKGGEKILRGLREAVARASGKGRARLHIVKVPNVKAIRERLAMSQREFAEAYRIPLTTLQAGSKGGVGRMHRRPRICSRSRGFRRRLERRLSGEGLVKCTSAKGKLSLYSPATMAYDANGNLTGDGTWTFAYDAQNMLRSSTSTASTSTYQYDPLGRRQMLTEGGTTTTFLHDGDEEIADYSAAAAVLRRYVPGPGTDMPIAMVTPSGGSNTRKYFHTNRQGSTIAMSADDGTMSEGPYTYDAYGNGAPATGVPFKYTGRRLDAGTGLYYYRARYYSAALGRFLQVDPVGYEDQMNLYAYVGEDPLNFTDPQGRDKWSVGGDITVVTGVGTKFGFEFSFDDETGQFSVSVIVSARVGGQAGVSGTATRTDSDPAPVPEGVSGDISVNGEAGVGPVRGQGEIGGINSKGETRGGGRDKEKVKVKAGGSVSGKVGASAGADLKVTGTVTLFGKPKATPPSPPAKQKGKQGSPPPPPSPPAQSQNPCQGRSPKFC